MLDKNKYIINNMNKDELKDYLIELKSIIKKEKLILSINTISILFGSYIDVDLFINNDLSKSYNVLLTFIIVALAFNFDYFINELKENKKLLKNIENEIKISWYKMFFLLKLIYFRRMKYE